MKSFVLFMITLAYTSSLAETPLLDIVPGAPWVDESGVPIQAHGGGILKHGDTWYWYGEDKRYGYFPTPGTSCYSSKDLVNWKHEGVVCPIWFEDGSSRIPDTPEQFTRDVQRPVQERPKVLYNEHTKQFVMWMHVEGYIGDPKIKYQISSAGVAVSDSPTGPFTFVSMFRPIPADLHHLFSTDATVDQQERGSTFRDMNLFQDDDGRAYVIYAAEGNYTMHVVMLTDDYRGVRELVEGETWNRILLRDHREAPAMFKHAGQYFLMTSGSTGWDPNAARLYVSNAILGPYTSLGNPCRGEDAHLTFRSQSTFILPIDLDKGHYIFMADQWEKDQIGDSRYVWLPFTVSAAEFPVIEWVDRWNLSVFEK